jgi:hypothetical protein
MSIRSFQIFMVVLLLIWFYASIEPFIYVYTGFGFIYDYNPDFQPLMYRK